MIKVLKLFENNLIREEITEEKNFSDKAKEAEELLKWLNNEIEKALKNKDKKRLDFLNNSSKKMLKIFK